MPGKKRTIGSVLRNHKPYRGGYHETLGDLDSSYRGGAGPREYHDLVRDVRDGASEQRCGGGVRIIRKRNPE